MACAAFFIVAAYRRRRRLIYLPAADTRVPHAGPVAGPMSPDMVIVELSDDSEVSSTPTVSITMSD